LHSFLICFNHIGPANQQFRRSFMITILRKNQRVLMLVIAILTIVAFIWLYNPADTYQLGRGTVATIYGRKVSQADVERQVKTYQLALAMGQLSLLENLGGMAQDENQALDEFIWNLFVLHHQAKELGVEPTDSQIAERIKAVRAFQTGGQFDPSKYKAFVLEQLGPRGFTEHQLENVIRDTLRLERIREIVTSPTAVSDLEFQDTARVLQELSAQVVRFPLASVAGSATVTEEEVKDFYQQYGRALTTPETRAVTYVKFEPVAGEKPLAGREKVEALQRLADAATAFSEETSATSFEKAASTRGLTVETTPEFDRAGAASTAGTEPIAADLKNLAPAAFLLTEQNPVSDVIQSGEAFFVLKLAKVNPQRPMTLEEVRPMAEKQLGARKAERLLREKAEPALAKIREAMAAGKSFSDAAAAEGMQVKNFDHLNPSGENISSEEQGIAAATLLMEPGQLSGLISDADGAFAVYLFERVPLDAAALEKKPELMARILESKRRLLFQTWLSSARDAARVTLASLQQ
jgi:peptidyl-prolyl cis-trans isomerase D